MSLNPRKRFEKTWPTHWQGLNRSGIYRVIYYLAGISQIWLIHAFQKKTQQTPKQDIDLVRVPEKTGPT